MASENLRATIEQLERLRGDILGESEPAAGGHLDEVVFIEYSMNTLAADQAARASSHLASCEHCTARLALLNTVATAWNGPKAQRRLDRQSQGILTKLAAARARRESASTGTNALAAPAPLVDHKWPSWWRRLLESIQPSRIGLVPVAAGLAIAVLATAALVLRERVRRSEQADRSSHSATVQSPAQDSPVAARPADKPDQGAPVARPQPLSPVEPGSGPATPPAGVVPRPDGSKPSPPRPATGDVAVALPPPANVAVGRAVTPPIGGGSIPPPPTPVTSAASPRATDAAALYPPDLPDVAAARKRLVAIKPFDYSTVTPWVNYWFNSNMNIGEGIRAMLAIRLQPSPNLTLVERPNINDLMREQDFGASNRVKKETNANIGQPSGADVILYGDIVIFGRDDTTNRRGLGAVLGRFSPVAGVVATMNKEEKAVVGIKLRLVDAETGEQIDAAEARGESSRSSKDYAGTLGVKGAGAGGAARMTGSDFQQTIIGEATSNAVANIVAILERKISQMPVKARKIEGRVATVTSNGAYLTVGSHDGVLRGDRFEILKINGEITDPVSREVIELDAVKVGELVVDTVREKGATGAYGGQALSSAYATTGKGYVARLISK